MITIVIMENSFLCEDKLIYDLDNIEGNIIDLKKQLRYEAAKFASYFYNELSMNTHVQTIINTTYFYEEYTVFIS